MNDTSIKPIGGVQQTENSIPAKAPIQSETVVQNRLAPSYLDKNPVEAKNESKAMGGSADVSIHFRVDDETNELTVFVVDRKTKRVVRSIPASELHKLQTGELLKLTA